MLFNTISQLSTCPNGKTFSSICRMNHQ